MPNSKAIVTLAIGQKYLKQWQRLCQLNWQKYAYRHGYDIICIDGALDNSERAKNRSPAWQKCLILTQEFAKNYERIVWIDADILINAALAPCIVEAVPIDKIGAVNGSTAPTQELYEQISLRRYEYLESQGRSFVKYEGPRDAYAKYGMNPEFEEFVQTGVMVLSPDRHRAILEKTYFEYEEVGETKIHYEAVPLSYELLKSEKIHWLDSRFNLCWADYRYLHYPFLLSKPEPEFSNSFNKPELLSALGVASRYKYTKMCATTAFINSFFLHFAGCAADMDLVDVEATS